MANANSTVAALHDPKRRDVAIEALGQAEFILVELQDVATRNESSEADMRAVVLALALRGCALVNAAQRLNDPAEDVDEIRALVRYGRDEKAGADE